MNPMRFSLYIGGCLLSGAVWSGIAYAIGKGNVPEDLLRGALPWGPLIGVVIGLFYLPAHRAPLWGQAIGSLFTLEISAVLFAMAMGEVKGDVSQNYYGVLYGLNLTGWVLILWPLSWGNHVALGRVLKPKPHGAPKDP